VFYGIYYGLLDGVLGYFDVELSHSARGLVSALSAVGVVNLIVAAFVVVAYTEKEPPVEAEEDTKEEETKDQDTKKDQ